MSTAFKVTKEERNALLVAVIVLSFAYQAFSGIVTLESLPFFLTAGALAVLIRELGQRIVAEYLDATVHVELSREGVIATVFGGVTAAISGLPVIFLLPLTNSYEAVEYEQWGKSVSGLWMKREFWLASAGIFSLFLFGMIAAVLNLNRLPDYFLMFAAFQLIPLDHEKLPAGLLDGVYILRQSGFYWLAYISMVLFALALV